MVVASEEAKCPKAAEPPSRKASLRSPAPCGPGPRKPSAPHAAHLVVDAVALIESEREEEEIIRVDVLDGEGRVGRRQAVVDGLGGHGGRPEAQSELRDGEARDGEQAQPHDEKDPAAQDGPRRTGPWLGLCLSHAATPSADFARNPGCGPRGPRPECRVATLGAAPIEVEPGSRVRWVAPCAGRSLSAAMPAPVKSAARGRRAALAADRMS